MIEKEAEKHEIKTERHHGIELLRIISMIMVIILHLNGHGGILSSSYGTNFWILDNIMETLCIIAVNLFALTTGYLCYNKKIKLKNIINLWLQVLFFSVIISSCYYIFNPKDFTIKAFLSYCMPILSAKYWYFTAYFILFLLMPMLNFVINNMPKKQLITLTLIILTASTCFAFVASKLFMSRDLFSISEGYSAFWLSILYIVGGIISKYHISLKLKKEVKGYVYLLLYFAFSTFSLISGYLQYGFVKAVIKYNSVFNTLSSISFFMFFVKTNFKQNNLISFLSKMSFGVYLIHEHPIIKSNFISGKFMFVLSYNPVISLIFIVICAITIYIVCSLIEYFRQVIFKTFKISNFSMYLDKKVNGIYNKIKIEENNIETKN